MFHFKNRTIENCYARNTTNATTILASQKNNSRNYNKIPVLSVSLYFCHNIHDRFHFHFNFLCFSKRGVASKATQSTPSLNPHIHEVKCLLASGFAHIIIMILKQIIS